MKFLGMAYEEERTLDELSEREWLELRKETLDYVEALRQSGRLIDTQALQSTTTASTVRVRDGKVTVTDGPFAETKEVLGGFFIVEARDISEAIEIAAKWPSARFGTVEVRPLEEGLRTDGRYRPISQTRSGPV
jgi:hypothetical protein